MAKRSILCVARKAAIDGFPRNTAMMASLSRKIIVLVQPRHVAPDSCMEALIRFFSFSHDDIFDFFREITHNTKIFHHSRKTSLNSFIKQRFDEIGITLVIPLQFRQPLVEIVSDGDITRCHIITLEICSYSTYSTIIYSFYIPLAPRVPIGLPVPVPGR
jgi:hypothetical protein